MEKHAF